MDHSGSRLRSLPANSKGFCKSCGDHVLTLKTDIYFDEYVDQASLKDNEGQAPWYFDDKMCCRRCNVSFWPLPIGLDWN